MATTQKAASYHLHIIKRYLNYLRPDLIDSHREGFNYLAEIGGIELSSLHEEAVAKFLNLERKSGDGFDLVRVCNPNDTVEAKYRRLSLNNKGQAAETKSETWIMRLDRKNLQGKTAPWLWITVYNQFIETEDHFVVPMKDINDNFFTFSYNKKRDDYNRGQKYLCYRGFFGEISPEDALQKHSLLYTKTNQGG
jgi:hypothetical protein